MFNYLWRDILISRQSLFWCKVFISLIFTLDGTSNVILMAVNSHLIVCEMDIVTTFLDLFVEKP